MKISYWLYISKSLIPFPRYEFVLNDIVVRSRQRNERLDVTGCLVFARTRFAQLLEGPTEAVSELRRSIEADSRHADIKSIDIAESVVRRFPGWSLAYGGPSHFVEGLIKDASASQGTAREQEFAGKLLFMMEQFLATTAA